MEQRTPFNVTLSSQTATILYLPNRDGDPSQGWNVTYTDGVKDTGNKNPQGVGVDYHRTAFSGATLEFSWAGTAVYIYGNATDTSAYVISVDGTDIGGDSGRLEDGHGLLGSLSEMDYGNHTVRLTVNRGEVAFQYAEVSIGFGSPVENQTVLAFDPVSNSSNSFFTYSGSSGSSANAHGWLVEDLKLVALSDGSNTPLPRQMVTAAAGNSVSFTLQNTSAFFLWGAFNLDHTTKSVTLDATGNGALKTTVINDFSSVLDFRQILHWEAGLDPDQNYTVSITNLNDAKSLSFSSLDIIHGGGSPTGSEGTSQTSGFPGVAGPSQSSEIGKSTSIAIIIGPVVGGVLLLAIIAGAVLYLRCRTKKRKFIRTPSLLTQSSLPSPFLTPAHSIPSRSDSEYLETSHNYYNTEGRTGNNLTAEVGNGSSSRNGTSTSAFRKQGLGYAPMVNTAGSEKRRLVSLRADTGSSREQYNDTRQQRRSILSEAPPSYVA